MQWAPLSLTFAKAGEYKPEYTFVLDVMGPEKARATVRKIDSKAIMEPTLGAIKRESGDKLVARARALGFMADVYDDKEFLAPLDEAMTRCAKDREEIVKEMERLQEKIDAANGEPDEALVKELNGLKPRKTGAERQWTRLVEATAMSGGLTSRLDRDLARWLGEHHQYLLEIPGFDGFLAPEPAILLRQLGPTQPVYEITNRLGQESKPGAGENAIRLLSRSANYIYRTPDYTIGCIMFDPTGGRKYGPLGLWSGVIFRDRKAVWLDAYTGEKWNVQKRDVMVTQCVRKMGYGGDPRIDFTPGWEMVEKDGWVFVSDDEAYVAVRIARGGCKWAKPDRRRRLMLNEKHSPIIIQTGRKCDYGSFAKFQKAIPKAPYTLTEEKLDYTGPNSARIEFFLADDPHILPKIDGRTLDLDLKYNYKSPFMENKVGSDIVTVRYGSRRWEYDFGKNTIIERSR